MGSHEQIQQDLMEIGTPLDHEASAHFFWALKGFEYSIQSVEANQAAERTAESCNRYAAMVMLGPRAMVLHFIS